MKNPIKPQRSSLWLALVPLLCVLLQCQRSEKDPAPPAPPTPPAGPVTIRDSVLTTNLSYPWEILWGPDNYIWMTERGGKISRVNPATGGVTPVFTVPDAVSIAEGGLLGMALHPNFSTTPQVFVVYNYSGGGTYREKLVRYTYSGGTLNNPQILLDNIAGANYHNGSRIVITPDLKLFLTTGDGTVQTYPQNPASVNGKVLRINLDGSIPADNPVPGNPYWSLGHRNPQGLVFANSKLYSSEHGPDNDDEINLIEKGGNYGWPNVEGYCDKTGEQSFCTTYQVREPLRNWTPTAAVSGLDYYNKDAIPQWKNSLLVVALKNARLYQLKLNDSFNTITETTEFFTNTYGRLRDLCISPAGDVYICTSNGSNDKIIRVRGQP